MYAHSQAHMVAEVRRRGEELVEEPMRRSTLRRHVSGDSAGMEFLPERALVAPPPRTIRHATEVEFLSGSVGMSLAK